MDLVVPQSERMGRLVVRNASAEGCSHGWFRLLKTTVEKEPKVGFEEAQNTEEVRSSRPSSGRQPKASRASGTLKPARPN